MSSSISPGQEIFGKPRVVPAGSVLFGVCLGDHKMRPVCQGQQRLGCEGPAERSGLGNLQRDVSSEVMWRGSSFEIWVVF